MGLVQIYAIFRRQTPMIQEPSKLMAEEYPEKNNRSAGNLPRTSKKSP